MAKVLFTVSYEIDEKKNDEFLFIAKELKSIMSAEGLEDYSIYKAKGKKNVYSEIYTFEDEESFENFDDEEDERAAILMSKLADIMVNKTVKYSTLTRVEFD